MAHDLRVGIDFRQGHVADRAAHDGTVEGTDVLGFRHERRKAFARPVIPECELAARVQANGRERLYVCHVTTPRDEQELTLFCGQSCAVEAIKLRSRTHTCCGVSYT